MQYSVGLNFAIVVPLVPATGASLGGSNQGGESEKGCSLRDCKHNAADAATKEVNGGGGRPLIVSCPSDKFRGM
jgi:hypothetical protein